MTSYGYPGTVEQILFGLARPGGVGVRRCSVGLSDSRAAVWNDRLSRYNRLSPIMVGGRPWVPDRAFSYFEFRDGNAALLARFKTGESGRNSSHALVGSAAALGPHAMSLSQWEGWRTDDPGRALPSVNPAEWRHLSEQWSLDAQLAMRDHRAAMIALVRAALQPDDSYVTIVFKEEPLPLLTLVRGVLDPIVSDRSDSEFGWTFSTYEASDTIPESFLDGDGAPRFWCVRSLPASGQTERQRVIIDGQPEDDGYGDLAANLVAGYLQDSQRYRAELEARLSGVYGRDQRVNELYQKYRVPASAPAAPPDLWAAPTPPEPYERRPDHPPFSRPEPAPQPRSAQPSLVPTAAPARRKLDVNRPRDADELFGKLDDDRLTPEQRQRYLAELKALWTGDDPYLANVGMTMRTVKFHLGINTVILGVAVLVLFFSGVLAWATARREITVPAPPTITVTVTPAPPVPSTPATAASRKLGQ